MCSLRKRRKKKKYKPAKMIGNIHFTASFCMYTIPKSHKQLTLKTIEYIYIYETVDCLMECVAFVHARVLPF